MEIILSGQKSILDEATWKLIENKVGRLGRRGRWVVRAEVWLKECPGAPGEARWNCEIKLGGRVRTLRGRADAAEALVAVDQTISKLRPQIERMRGRVLGRVKRARGRASSAGLTEQGTVS